MAFLSKEQLEEIGFKKVGNGILISDKTSIYGADRIEIGDFTRIDDFCVLSAGSGGLKIGRNCHIACYVSIIGSEKIILEDFVGISSKCAIYSSSDDYSGRYMTGPTVPKKFTNIDSRPVTIKKHVIMGAMTLVLPGVTIGEGAAIGALSLVSENCEKLKIYNGVPVKPSKTRSDKILELEKQYLSEYL